MAAKAKIAKAKIAKTKIEKTKTAKNKSTVQVGKIPPAFSLEGTGGLSFSSDKFKGRAVVLYFYPRDATPGCTLEGHEFSKLLGKFKAAGSEVFGISRDTLTAHEKFKAKEKYKLDLLSDMDEEACEIFGVIKMKNMYGKKVRGIERSTFVLDRKGQLAKEWRGVKVPGHAEEVLDFVKTL